MSDHEHPRGSPLCVQGAYGYAGLMLVHIYCIHVHTMVITVLAGSSAGISASGRECKVSYVHVW